MPVPVPAPKRIPDPPDPSVWAEATVLRPQTSTPVPEFVSDGGGLPFRPSAVDAPFEPLDPSEPSVQALLEQIELSRRQAQPKRLLRPPARPPKMSDSEKLQGWRALALTDDEILYGRGRPPQLITAQVKEGWRGNWKCLGVSAARPLRAARDGIRASSWRLDPTQPVGPESTELRILLTEQTKSSGTLAQDRLLAPDLHAGPHEVVLRLYVKPIEGYVGGMRRFENPVIVALPEPLGERQVLDGSLYVA